MPLAYDVVIRSVSGEWAGPSVCVRRDSSGWLFDQVTVTGLASDRVDVVFRPSPAAAARTLDVDEIWDGKVVLKDVLVE